MVEPAENRPIAAAHRVGRGFWGGALVSFGIGVLVGALVQLGRGSLGLIHLGLGGAIGLLIFLLAHAQLAATGALRERLGGAAHSAVLTAIFALSGVGSWLVVATTFALATGSGFGRAGGAFWVSVGLTGFLAVMIGFAFYAYERLRRDLSEKISRLQAAEFAQRELELARAMQRRLLPPMRLDAGSYRLAARNQPADWVAGDFYDVFTLADGRLGVALGDVAGKGMATSLIMASVKAMLPLLATGRTPVETLAALNARLIEDLGSREFVAVAFGVYTPETGEIELANAALPDPYLLRASGEVAALVVPGQRLPLGVRQDAAYRSTSAFLGAGDRLLMVTDGLPEARVGSDDLLGYEEFARLLPRRTAAPDAFLERLFAAVSVRSPGAPSDDWTALLLERPAEPA